MFILALLVAHTTVNTDGLTDLDSKRHTELYSMH